MHKRHTRNLGFTIVEMMVAIAVIAILVTVTIVAYNGVQDSAKEKKTIAELDRVYDELVSWRLTSGGGIAPTDLSDANLELPNDITFNYWGVNKTMFCIEAIGNSGAAKFYRATTQESAKAGGCGDSIDWVAGTPLGFTNTPGATVNLSKPLVGTPDITLYVLFYTADASDNYTGFAGLGPAGTNNRFYFQASAASNTGAGYRIDTPLQTNVTAAQANVRTTGVHSGWMQTSDNGTTRSYAYDTATPTSTGTLTAHTGWNFTNLSLAGNAGTYSTYSTVVYDKVQDAETRTAVLNWMYLKAGMDRTIY